MHRTTFRERRRSRKMANALAALGPHVENCRPPTILCKAFPCPGRRTSTEPLRPATTTHRQSNSWSLTAAGEAWRTGEVHLDCYRTTGTLAPPGNHIHRFFPVLTNQ
jgi:hypothetical protein